MVLDFKKPYRARVVPWLVSRRRKLLLRSPVDEFGTKATVATDVEIKVIPFKLGDVVNGGREGFITRGIVVLVVVRGGASISQVILIIVIQNIAPKLHRQLYTRRRSYPRPLIVRPRESSESFPHCSQ